jgi:hypothetical protein
MRVGSLVELINDNWVKIVAGESLPVKGKIYTVREIEGNGIRLEEIVNPIMMYSFGMRECRFNAAMFREVLPPIDLVEELQGLASRSR